jgi:hypothetical protein
MSPLEADSHSAPGRHFFNRSLLLLLLMLTLGVTGVNAQLPALTTDTDNSGKIEESEKHYYLLQNVGTPSFYAVPYNNDDEAFLSTANVPNSDMRFYFMSVENEEGYYYIIHCSGKYLYAMGNANVDGGARLKESSTQPEDSRYKFSIEQNGGGYYIINKQLGSTAPLCKRGGNTGIGKKDNNNPNYYFLKWNTWNNSGARDDFFRWNFIPISDTTPITWTPPFSLSTDESRSYYKIKNSVDTDFYISQNNSTVNTSDTESNDMVWFFKEVPTGENGSDTYTTYYYIIHALTGKYMCFDGDPSLYSQNQENKVSIKDKNDTNEENCQFIVVRSSQRNPENLYNIIPKALKSYIWNNQSLEKKNGATLVRTATDRSGDTNRARWIFETTTFDVAWEDPVVTCDLDGHITITNGEEAAGAVFYYTIDGSTVPTTENNLYDATNKPTVSAGKTTIMVRAIALGRNSSNVVTKTIVYNPLIAFTENSYTYTGNAQNPVSSVDYVDTDNSANNIHFEATTHYTVSYKKGEDVVSECKNVDTYTVVINDVEGDDYIVCGTKPFTINQKSVTITAKDATKVYNGTALTESDFTATALETGDTHEFAVTMAEESTITNVGTQANVIVTVDGTAVTTGTATSVGNYLVTTADGTLTINPKAVTITAGDASKYYNGTALTSDNFTPSALEEGDTHTFTVVMTEGSTITNVGTQPNVIATVDGVEVTTGTATPVGNYSVTTANGTLTINAKAVTITARNAEKEYDGTPLTSDGFTATDLEAGDTHTFTVVMTEGSTITNVGTQPNVIATVDGTAVTTGEATAIGNYLVTTANGTLTITKKTLTITADSDTKVYDGTALTKDSYTSEGLMTGDNIESVSITGSQTNVGTSDNVPSAAIVKKGDAVVTDSYAINYVNGTLTITPAAVTVTAVAESKTYGEADPDLTANVEGMVNDESSALITYSLSRAEGEDVGEYTITPTGDAEQGNYSISYTTGMLTIGPKELGITWTHTDDLVYNRSAQKPTATATGLVGSDVIGVTVTVTGGGTNAGSYTATASELTGEKAGNYKLPDPAPTSPFTINKAQLMAVNLENAEFIYNGEEQSVTITNVTAGDGTLVTVSDVPSEEYEVSGNSATNAGTHTVTVTPKSPSTNYDTDVSQSNSFTIGKKSIGDGTDPATASGITIDITWNDNESNPYTVEVKDGESLLAAGTEGTGHAYSLSATGDHDTKYYTVTVTGANNYDGTFTAKYANVRFDSDGSPGAMWYGTFVAEADHAKPAGMTPYIITSVADNTATAVELDYIPNGVPVVLMNAEDAKGFLVQSGTGEISTTGNLLAVQATDEEKATATVYLLYKGEFVLNKAGTLEAGTVYLPVSSGSGARLKISRGDNTGIENIEYTIESQSDAWYTLDGRRLSSKPTKKGVYLQGGKKIVVK